MITNVKSRYKIHYIYLNALVLLKGNNSYMLLHILSIPIINCFTAIYEISLDMPYIVTIMIKHNDYHSNGNG